MRSNQTKQSVLVKKLAENGYFFTNEGHTVSDSLDEQSMKIADFEKRQWSIRLANTSTDLDDLLKLEASCWDTNLQSDADVIKSRIQGFPAGQWVVIKDDHVVGVLYTQLIKSRHQLLDVSSTRYENQQELCDPENGKVLQLMGIAVLPSVKHLLLGDSLRDFVLLCAHLDGCTEVVAMTRCSAYKNNSIERKDNTQAAAAYEVYVKSHTDPTILFHELKGASVIDVVKGYRIEYHNNLGNDVFIRY